MISVFFSYSHADEELRDQLEQQLSIMRRQNLISTWHDRRIIAGSEIDHSIDTNLEDADVILLLVSPSFLASDYCYDREMARAMERHERGEARVIPVILRACDWNDTPFGKLLATPTDGKPITLWADRDQAFLEVTKSIKAAVKEMEKKEGSQVVPIPESLTQIVPPVAANAPRSSNLRLAKHFTDREKDAFKIETFEYMARYFEHSLSELQMRNPGVEGVFRRVDANRFFASIYRDGKSVVRCTVFIGASSFINGIVYSGDETTESNSFNECLTVYADDMAMYLKNMGMASYMRNDDAKFTQEGASEFYWSMLIEPLQSR